jgi:PEP-CTERM motif
MKMKLAVAFAVLFFASQAHADSTPITLDVTAISCQAACDEPFEPTLDLEAQLVVEEVTGTFTNPVNIVYNQPVYEVMSMTGTLNGYPVTLLGTEDYLDDNATDLFQLGYVTFTADGYAVGLFDDDTNDLLETSNPVWAGNNLDIIAWTAVDPAPVGAPEPSSLLLSGIGLAALIGLKLKA